MNNPLIYVLHYSVIHVQTLGLYVYAHSATLGVLPFYIPLNEVPVDSKNIIADWLTQHGFTEQGIAALKHHYAVVVILRGYECTSNRFYAIITGIRNC